MVHKKLRLIFNQKVFLTRKYDVKILHLSYFVLELKFFSTQFEKALFKLSPIFLIKVSLTAEYAQLKF